MKNDFLSQELFRRKSGKTRLVGPIKLTQHVAHIVWIDLAIKNARTFSSLRLLDHFQSQKILGCLKLNILTTQSFYVKVISLCMYQHFHKLQQRIFNNIRLLNYWSFKNETNKVIQ